MKSSARDDTEGKLHQAKGAVKEAVGKMIGNRNLRAEGKGEHLRGKVQEKLGQIKKVAGR